jgi:hypothetical protein
VWILTTKLAASHAQMTEVTSESKDFYTVPYAQLKVETVHMYMCSMQSATTRVMHKRE